MNFGIGRSSYLLAKFRLPHMRRRILYFRIVYYILTLIRCPSAHAQSERSSWVILARLEQLVFFSSEVWYSHRTSWKRPKNWSRLVPQSGEDSASSLLFDKFVVFLQQSIIIGKIRNFEPIFMLCMIFFSLLLVLWLQFDFLDIFLGFETSRYILEWSPNANCFQKMKNSMNNRQCTEIGFFG